MKCKKCRKEIPDGSRFCNHCGTPTEKKKLYRRPDGLYEKILTIDGRRVAFRARKESEVYKKICEYEQKQEQGPLFTEVAEMWYDEHWETLSPTTQNGYKFAYGEITEYFAGKYLRQITHKNINAYIKQLPKSYARKTCATRLTILNIVLLPFGLLLGRKGVRVSNLCFGGVPEGGFPGDCVFYFSNNFPKYPTNFSPAMPFCLYFPLASTSLTAICVPVPKMPLSSSLRLMMPFFRASISSFLSA